MNKKEFIDRYGKEAYEKWLQQRRDWYSEHLEQSRERNQVWRLNHPEEVKVSTHEYRKGGKYYEQRQEYISNGLPHERKLVRDKHRSRYRKYKKIIAPDSQIHHEWIPETADYRGVALVEKDQHMHGFVDVILILEGEITLSEEEIKRS